VLVFEGLCKIAVRNFLLNNGTLMTEHRTHIPYLENILFIPHQLQVEVEEISPRASALCTAQWSTGGKRFHRLFVSVLHCTIYDPTACISMFLSLASRI
jgi:hypothetical protein